jgi:prepilin-type N-terminal cleavage/methylation domain-containing protein
MRQNKGFTLLEILLVIAAIGILAAIVLVAINPNRQIESAKNAVRQSDINTIQKAIQQYSIDNGGVYPAGIEIGAKAICNTGSQKSTDTLNPANLCDNKVNLKSLVPDYLASIPEPDSNYYYIIKNNNSNNIEVRYANTVDNIWNIGGVPSLDLNFASNKNLIDNVSGKNLVNFSRNSPGTYVGADGLIKTAGVNEPRFDHDPVTGESLGLLVEDSRINYHRYSTNFANWTSNSGTSTITPTMDVIDPFGGTGAYVLNGWMQRNSEPGPGSGSSFRFRGSVFVKRHPLGRNILNMQLTAAGGDSDISINFDTETVTASGQSPQNPTIQKYPNGWYRIGLSITPASTFWRPVIGITPSTDTYWYVFGVQIENGLFETSYIPTSGSAVPRQADNVGITGNNFSSWYNRTEGALFIKFLYNNYNGCCSGTPTPTPVSWHLTESPVVGWPYGIFHTNDGKLSFRDDGGGAITLSNFNNNQDFAKVRSIFSYNSTNRFASANGNNVVNSSYVENNIHNSILIGRASAWGQYGYLSRPISRLVYWPTRLPNSTLQAITQ